MKYVNMTTFKDKLRQYRHRPGSLILFMAVCLSALATMLALAFVIIYI